MTCQKCSSDRIVFVTGKASDLHVVQIQDKEHEGYLPSDMGIGGGDYMEFDYCLQCGQIQGNWPLPKTNLELGEQVD